MLKIGIFQYFAKPLAVFFVSQFFLDEPVNMLNSKTSRIIIKQQYTTFPIFMYNSICPYWLATSRYYINSILHTPTSFN